MKISWEITEGDIQQVKKVLAQNDNNFTRRRRERNVEKKDVVIDKEMIMQAMMMCLITSQQRSGPNSLVSIFLVKKPFPVTFQILSQSDNIARTIKQVLLINGLKRYVNNISKYYAANYEKIEKDNWSIITELKDLLYKDSKREERKIADKIDESFLGFGPKQSRNFLQALGLTKYEIPIDSRIIRWLNMLGFPVTLHSTPLGNKEYYHFVLDGVQELSANSGVYPCILDAAIFSSYDKGEWTSENIRF